MGMCKTIKKESVFLKADSSRNLPYRMLWKSCLYNFYLYTYVVVRNATSCLRLGLSVDSHTYATVNLRCPTGDILGSIPT